MALHQLTDAACRNAVCHTGTVRKLADGGGLYLWVGADGSKRWRYRYAVRGINRKGEPALIEKLVSLGTYPQVPLAEARVEAAKLRGQADPAAEKKAEKRATAAATSNSFEALARQWHKNHAVHWSTKYGDDILKRLVADVFPTLGPRPVTAIEAPEIIAVLRPVQARGNLALAFRILGHIVKVLDYAINIGVLTHNVAIGREGALQPAPYSNHPHVAPSELPDLLHAIDDYHGDRRTRFALQLLSMTFVRVSELLLATWDEFDFDTSTWEIPADRMKMRRPHLVPLAPQVVSILEELKTFSCGSQFVLPGRSLYKPIDRKTLRSALDKLGYAGKMTCHGFRHVASTALNEARDGDAMMFDPDAIEAQLAHLTQGVRGRYNKAKYLPERRRMMQWYADHLDELRNG